MSRYKKVDKLLVHTVQQEAIYIMDIHVHFMISIWTIYMLINRQKDKAAQRSNGRLIKV